jgi:hypothetical protein
MTVAPATFTPDEIKQFETLSDEEKTLIGKYHTWLGQKENPAPPPISKEPPKSLEAGALPTLEQMTNWLENPRFISILKHLMGEAEASKAAEAAKKSGTPQRKSGSLLKLI